MRRLRPEPGSTLKVRVASSFGEITAPAWDALAGEDNPFVEHAFLSLLERSGCLGAENGWDVRAVLVERGGELVGAAPAFEKTDSFGEYIFDWSWAEAAARARLPYYPKIVVAVPFTPATGPRLLVNPREPGLSGSIREKLVEGLLDLRSSSGASSVHVLFPAEEEASFLESQGFLRRSTYQFHWRNAGYASFDDFLAALRSEPRKQIRKERRRVVEAGVEVSVARGDEISSADWELLFQIYRSTTDRKWGRPYLTEQFFLEARQAIGRRAVVVWARRAGRVIAASLSFEKGPNLYGRYWGAFEQVDGLHFELCYYRLIEHAIATGQELVEAGAQGEHKLKRGFTPAITHSAHAFRDKPLGEAIARAVARERRAVEEAVARESGPYRVER